MSSHDIDPAERTERIRKLEAELAELRRDSSCADIAHLDGRMSRLLLSQASNMASVGAWCVDLETNELTWSDETFRIHELPRDRQPTVEEAIAYYPPEAQEAVRNGLEKLLETGEVYDLQLPLTTARGRQIWVRAVGDVDRDRHGKPLRLVGVFQEVTRQVELAQQQEQARLDAEEVARAKSEFLATMSHELRTPLNGIIGMAQALSSMELQPEHRDCVSAIERSGDALLVVINDVLDLSKIDAGRIELEETPFDVHGVVREAMDMLACRALDQTVEVTANVDASVGRRLGDPARIRQVLLNLIGNAIKFTAEGHVRVSVRSSGTRVRVEVEDTGIGISAEAMPHLFEPFRQADSSTTRRFGGTGLGLSICQRLIHLMGGSIGATSQLGHGSRFWFDVPLAPANEVDEAAAAESSIEEEEHARGAEHGEQLNVLVVEDHPVNQAVARRLIESLGHRTTVAADGQEALDALDAQPFDVVLMDCQMPVLDGYEATRARRSHERSNGWDRTPIIAMTANAMAGDRQRCIEAGMDDYLSKPVRRDVLAAALRRWAKRPAEAA